MALDHPNTIEQTEIIRFNALKRRPPSPAPRPSLCRAPRSNPAPPNPHPPTSASTPASSSAPGAAPCCRRRHPRRPRPPAAAICAGRGLLPPPSAPGADSWRRRRRPRTAPDNIRRRAPPPRTPRPSPAGNPLAPRPPLALAGAVSDSGLPDERGSPVLRCSAISYSRRRTHAPPSGSGALEAAILPRSASHRCCHRRSRTLRRPDLVSGGGATPLACRFTSPRLLAQAASSMAFWRPESGLRTTTSASR